MRFHQKALVLALLGTTLVAGCDDDDDSSSPAPVTGSQTGVLTDAAVAGVPYTTSSGVTGVTNGRGEYRYNDGDTVTFDIAGEKISVPATGRISPAVIAAELFPGDEASATINLALLLQSLDKDGNPDNGIEIPAGLVLDGFNPEKELVRSPADFAARLAAVLPDELPAAEEPVRVADAIRHYYQGELTGNWRATAVFVDGKDVSSELDRIGFIMAFDAFGRAVYATWDTNGTTDERTADAAVGAVAYPTDDANLDVGLTGLSRALRPLAKDDSAPPSATDPHEDLFDATMRLSGSTLVLDINGDRVVYERLDNVKGSLVGGWVETDSQENEVPDIDPPRADGALRFGDGWGIFNWYVSETQLVHAVLDLQAKGDDNEANGVIVANYRFDDGEFVVGKVQVDTVSKLADKVYSEGDTYRIGEETLNGIRRTTAVDGEPGKDDMYRILSTTERLVGFVQ